MTNDQIKSGGEMQSRIDAAQEYPCFASWWTRTVQTEVPAATSHYFDTWMASARLSRTPSHGRVSDSEDGRLPDGTGLPMNGAAKASPPSVGIPDAALVEKVAKAIYLAYANHPDARWDYVDPRMQEGVWRTQARAAIAAEHVLAELAALSNSGQMEKGA